MTAPLHRNAVQRELPADQPRQRLHRGLVERDVGERPEAGDAGGVAVVALRLGADDRRLDPARAALEDRAVAVDEEVVTDVVPAVGVAVVAGDAEHDAGRILGRVVDRRPRCGGRTRPAPGRSSAGCAAVPARPPQPARVDHRGRAGRRPGRGPCARARGRERATSRALSCRAWPRRRSWSSSAAPVKAGSVPLRRRVRVGRGSSASSGRRCRRARAARARERRRPSAGRRGRSGAAPGAPAWLPRVCSAGRAGARKVGPGRGAATAVAGKRSAPSAAAPRPRAWRRVMSIAASNTAWPRSERPGPCTRSCVRGRKWE